MARETNKTRLTAFITRAKKKDRRKGGEFVDISHAGRSQSTRSDGSERKGPKMAVVCLDWPAWVAALLDQIKAVGKKVGHGPVVDNTNSLVGQKNAPLKRERGDINDQLTKTKDGRHLPLWSRVHKLQHATDPFSTVIERNIKLFFLYRIKSN